jgi:hypothetical protein
MTPGTAVIFNPFGFTSTTPRIKSLKPGPAPTSPVPVIGASGSNEVCGISLGKNATLPSSGLMANLNSLPDRTRSRRLYGPTIFTGGPFAARADGKDAQIKASRAAHSTASARRVPVRPEPRAGRLFGSAPQRTGASRPTQTPLA